MVVALPSREVQDGKEGRGPGRNISTKSEFSSRMEMLEMFRKEGCGVVIEESQCQGQE